IVNGGTGGIVILSSSATAPVNTNYTLQLSAMYGRAPYTWAIGGGAALHAGLTLDSSTGQITGIATTTGSTTLTVLATDTTARTASKDIAFTVGTSPPAFAV